MTDIASFRVLPQIFYSEEYTFFGHTSGGTWYGSDVAVVLWLVEKPWISLCILVGCLLVTLGAVKGLRLRRTTYELVKEGILSEA